MWQFIHFNFPSTGCSLRTPGIFCKNSRAYTPSCSWGNNISSALCNLQKLWSFAYKFKMLSAGSSFYWYGNLDKKCSLLFPGTFSIGLDNITAGIITRLGAETYRPYQWRFLLIPTWHTWKVFFFTAVANTLLFKFAHSMHSKETYESLSLLLKEGRYKVLGSTCERYNYSGDQHQVKQKCYLLLCEHDR